MVQTACIIVTGHAIVRYDKLGTDLKIKQGMQSIAANVIKN